MDQLSRKLESLCQSALIVRQEFSESPPRVEYQLTEKGRSFIPILKRLLTWSTENLWSAPILGEEIDIALSLRTIAMFYGEGAGTALIRIFFSKGGEFFLVEKAEDGQIDVKCSDDSNFETADIDVTLELSMEEWVRIITTAGPKNKIRVRGHIIGNKKMLMKMLPILSYVDWIDETRAFSSFGEIDSNQEPWRNATEIQGVSPTKG